MKQLRVRKLTTAKSNNVWFALFEEGEIQTPIKLCYENEIRELGEQIKEALEEK